MPLSEFTSRNNYKVLGILIRSQRITMGYSLRELAEHTNISHTLISNIEKGKQIPTPNTLADIFKVLNLVFYDDDEISTELKLKARIIYDYLFNQDYSEAKKIFATLQEKEDIYMNSIEIVNYVLMKALFNTMTKTNEGQLKIFIDHYEKVLEFFSDEQKQLYYYIKGIYYLNNEIWVKASQNFKIALSLGNKSLDVFIKQYNIVSLVRQYKFIDAYRYSVDVIKTFEERSIYTRAMSTKLQVARILYHIAKNDETLELVQTVQQFAEKFKMKNLQTECLIIRTEIKIRTDKFQEAEKLINKIPNNKPYIANVLLFEMAFLKNDLVLIEKYYGILCKDTDFIKNEKAWLFKQVQTMSKIESLYNKEVYIKKIKRLVELAVEANDQSLIGVAHNYLIMHYHEERSYKKALLVSEKLLHLKKIRIENR